jgi:hypothetical protein
MKLSKETLLSASAARLPSLLLCPVSLALEAVHLIRVEDRVVLRELPSDEAGIVTIDGEQALMVSNFENLTVANDSDLIRIDHSRETMRHEDHGRSTLCDQTIKSLLHLEGNQPLVGSQDSPSLHSLRQERRWPGVE